MFLSSLGTVALYLAHQESKDACLIKTPSHHQMGTPNLFDVWMGGTYPKNVPIGKSPKPELEETRIFD